MLRDNWRYHRDFDFCRWEAALLQRLQRCVRDGESKQERESERARICLAPKRSSRTQHSRLPKCRTHPEPKTSNKAQQQETAPATNQRGFQVASGEQQSVTADQTSGSPSQGDLLNQEARHLKLPSRYL